MIDIKELSIAQSYAKDVVVAFVVVQPVGSVTLKQMSGWQDELADRNVRWLMKSMAKLQKAKHE